MFKPTLLLIGLIASLCSGCAMTGTARVVNALSKDPATVSIVVPSPYGSVRITRTMIQTNQTITVSPDGSLTIKTAP